MNLRRVLITIGIVLFVHLTGTAQSEVVLTCKSVGDTSITWERAGIFRKEGLVPKVHDSSKMVLSLVLSKSGVIVKGNAGQSAAKWISDDTFVETEAMSLPIWKIIPAKDNIPMTVFQMKAYTLVTPASYTTAWECH